MIKNEEQALEVDPFEGDYGDSTDAVLKNAREMKILASGLKK